jgi:hypothetical protein
LLNTLNAAFVDDLKIIIKSQSTGNSNLIHNSRNEMSKFYFLKIMMTKSIYPFLRTHNIKGKGNLNQSVTLECYTPVLLSREIYCKWYDSNNIVRYSKAEYSGGNPLKMNCYVENDQFDDVSTPLFVSLWVKASSEINFDLTDNQTFLFIREPISWESLVYMSEIKALATQILNISVPMNKFIYKLKMIPNLQNASLFDVNCDFSIKPVCKFTTDSIASITHIPSALNISLTIQHPNLNNSSIIQVDSVIYYSTMNFQHLKPFAFSYYEFSHDYIRIVANVMKKLNKNFTFKCNVTQNTSSVLHATIFDLQSKEFEYSLEKESHFAFLFKTFGNGEDFSVSLMFSSLIGNINLTPIPATLKAFKLNPSNEIAYSPVFGPSTGGFKLNILFNIPYPTKNYFNYTINAKLLTSNGYKSIECEELSNCLIPSVKDLYLTWNEPKKFKIDIFINSIRAFSLSPYFTFYPDLQIDKVEPSYLVQINQASQMLKFYLSNSLNLVGGNVIMHYKLDSTTTPYDCSKVSEKVISCPTPTFTKVGISKLALSVGSFQTVYQLNYTLQAYDINEISITNTSVSKLNYHNQTSILVKGKNFINSDIVKVKLFDKYISKVLTANFIDQSTINVTVSPFYDLNIRFGRNVSLGISFDSEVHFKLSSNVLWIPQVPMITVSPTQTPKNQLSNFSLTGLENVYYNASMTILILRLYYNDSLYIPVHCTDSFSNCKINHVPTISGSYEIRFGLVDLFGNWSRIYFLTNSPILVYGNFFIP